MSEAKVTTQQQEDDERLVAYLDGELDSSDRRDLEQRLIDDSALRVRLRELQASWEMLNHLPSPASDEQLVRTTLQFVVEDLVRSNDNFASVQRPESSPKSRLQSSRWRRWTSAILMGGMVTFSTVLFLHFRRTRSEMNDWPVAMDLDAYAIGDDLDFIRRLALIQSWQDMLTQSPSTEIEAELDRDALATMTTSQFRKRLANLMPEPRAIASSNWERFVALPMEQQERFRQVADKVAAAPDRETLLATMRRYARWRAQLSGETVDAIESASADELPVVVASGVRETLSDIARISGDNLSDDAVERIDFILQEIVKERLDRGDRRTVAFHAWVLRRIERVEDKQALKATVAAMVFDDFSERMSRGGWMIANSMVRDRRETGVAMPLSPTPLTHSELELLVSMLPDTEMEQFASLPQDEWMQGFILRQWCEEALRRQFRGKRKTLAEQYAELPAGEREIIDLLPPEEARERLTRDR